MSTYQAIQLSHLPALPTAYDSHIHPVLKSLSCTQSLGLISLQQEHNPTRPKPLIAAKYNRRVKKTPIRIKRIPIVKKTARSSLYYL